MRDGVNAGPIRKGHEIDDFLPAEPFLMLARPETLRLREALRRVPWNPEEHNYKRTMTRPSGVAASAYGDWSQGRGITIRDLVTRLRQRGAEVPSESSLQKKLQGKERISAYLLVCVAREANIRLSTLFGLPPRRDSPEVNLGRLALRDIDEVDPLITELLVSFLCVCREAVVDIPDGERARLYREGRVFSHLAQATWISNPEVIKQICLELQRATQRNTTRR